MIDIVFIILIVDVDLFLYRWVAIYYFVFPLSAYDPDFALQGEYADATRGMQVIALGDGEFQVVIYTDGLPGAGWNGKDKQTLEVDVDDVEAMLEQFKRVDRQSPTLGATPPAGASSICLLHHQGPTTA